MTNLLTNPDFEAGYSGWNVNLGGGASWATVAVVPHSGTFCSRTTIPDTVSDGGFIRQFSIPLSLSSNYILTFWYRAISTPAPFNTLSITVAQPDGPSFIQNFALGSGVDIGVWKQGIINFVGGSSVTVTFAWSQLAGGPAPSFIADLDDMFLGLAPIPCFVSGSLVDCRGADSDYRLPIEETVQGETMIKTKDGVETVKLLVISGPTNRLVLIKKDLLGLDLPCQDLTATHGHGIIVDGQEIKAINVPGAVRLQDHSELVYTLIFSERTTITVNGLEVVADGEKEYQRFLAKKR